MDEPSIKNPYDSESPSPQDSVDRLHYIISKLHSDGTLRGLINDGQPHILKAHASNDACEREAKEALTKWRDAAIRSALVELDGELPEKKQLAPNGHSERVGFNECLKEVHQLIQKRLNDE